MMQSEHALLLRRAFRGERHHGLGNHAAVPCEHPGQRCFLCHLLLFPDLKQECLRILLDLRISGHLQILVDLVDLRRVDELGQDSENHER